MGSVVVWVHWSGFLMVRTGYYYLAVSGAMTELLCPDGTAGWAPGRHSLLFGDPNQAGLFVTGTKFRLPAATKNKLMRQMLVKKERG